MDNQVTEYAELPVLNQNEFSAWMDQNFTRTANVGQWQNEHLIFDYFGNELTVWNRLNMRYVHKRFSGMDQEMGNPYERARAWLLANANAPLEVPERWKIIPPGEQL